MTDDLDPRRRACDDCGPYLLGALRPDAVAAFERHLIDCPECQDNCLNLGPLVSGLGALSPAEVRALLDPPGPVVDG